MADAAENTLWEIPGNAILIHIVLCFVTNQFPPCRIEYTLCLKNNMEIRGYPDTMYFHAGFFHIYIC